MVRCRRVIHPRQWDWLGYHEIMGRRRRYRVLDLDRLCWRLQTDSLEEVGKNLEGALEDRIARQCFEREAWWTESLAVGSAGFMEKVRPFILSRQETALVPGKEGMWVLQEAADPYSAKTLAEIDGKAAI